MPDRTSEFVRALIVAVVAGLIIEVIKKIFPVFVCNVAVRLGVAGLFVAAAVGLSVFARSAADNGAATVARTRTIRRASAYSLIAAIIVVSSPLFGGECNRCPYRGNTDDATAENLIKAEGQAVMQEDMSTIRSIFAEDAVVQDMFTNRLLPVEEHYTKLFEECDFTRIVHDDIHRVSESAGRLVYTSGSEIRFRCSGGEVTTSDHPPVSNEWTLVTNESGCWVIRRLRYNIDLFE